MKTVIPLKSFVTREEVLANIKANGGTCYLHLECDWDMASYDYLNSILDDEVDNGTYLCDVTYDPIKLDNGSLIFEVCAVDCDEYVTQCEEESVD
jgi:hypothetical protein